MFVESGSLADVDALFLSQEEMRKVSRVLNENKFREELFVQINSWREESLLASWGKKKREDREEGLGGVNFK